MNSLFQPIHVGLYFQIQWGKGPLRPVDWFDMIGSGLGYNCTRFMFNVYYTIYFINKQRLFQNIVRASAENLYWYKMVQCMIQDWCLARLRKIIAMRTSAKTTIWLVSLISPFLDGTQLTFTVNSTCSFMLWFPPPPPCLPPLFAMIRLDLLQLSYNMVWFNCSWCWLCRGGGAVVVGFCVATSRRFGAAPKRNWKRRKGKLAIKQWPPLDSNILVKKPISFFTLPFASFSLFYSAKKTGRRLMIGSSFFWVYLCMICLWPKEHNAEQTTLCNLARDAKSGS